MVKKSKKEKNRELKKLRDTAPSSKEKRLKKKKKEKKVQVARFARAETLTELQDRVSKILSLRKKPTKFAKKLTELLTIRAGSLTHACYVPGVEQQIIRGDLPWVRIMHTDSLSDTSMSIICFSDSALKTATIAKRLVLGFANSEVINKNDGVLIK